MGPGNIRTKTAFVRAGFIACFLFCMSFEMSGQAGDKKPDDAAQASIPKLSFDVASIRETHTDNGRVTMMGSKSLEHEASYEGTNVPLNWLVQEAYGMRWDQVIDREDWTKTKLFVIQARSDEASTEVLKKLSDKDAKLAKQNMLQDLLATRFHLKVHTETRDLPVYTLTVGKKGPKLQPSKLVSTGDAAADAKNNRTKMSGRCDQRGCEYTVANYDFSNIVKFLVGQLGAEVKDETGLTGKYDYSLQFKGREPGDQPDNGTTDWPPLTTAVQEAMGLKLDRGKGPVQVVVIDHAEMPTEN